MEKPNPKNWTFYVVPDVITWTTKGTVKPDIQFYDDLDEAFNQFQKIKKQREEKRAKLSSNAPEPYSWLLLGIQKTDETEAIDLMLVRKGRCVLLDDDAKIPKLREDPEIRDILAYLSEKIELEQRNRTDSVKAVKGNFYDFYQLNRKKPVHDFLFMGYDWLMKKGLSPKPELYTKVYSGPIKKSKDDVEILETLYQRFNLNRPLGFKGHSMSVSDIVCLHIDGKTTYYFCDSIGFKKLDNFSINRSLPENNKIKTEGEHEI